MVSSWELLVSAVRVERAETWPSQSYDSVVVPRRVQPPRDSRVRYVAVSGTAVVLHGFVRHSVDLDVVISQGPDEVTARWTR